MLDHLTLHVKDIDRSITFYKQALAPLGYVMIKDLGAAAGFGVMSGAKKSSDPAGEFWVGKGAPHPPLVHVAFSAATRGAVGACRKAGLAAGGRDSGPPGLRERCHPDYCGAFILDPDGYNIEAVCHLPG